MSEDRNWFNSFAHFMDQNIRGVQYGVYTISGLALLAAFRTVRPFMKFVKPSDIPRHFIAEKQSFIGKVTKIEYSSRPGKNPLLSVDHYPLLPLPWKKVHEGLPVEVANVQVTLNGLSWLQRVLVGKEISFTPLKIENDKAPSIVYSERTNVGCQLVGTGLATVSPMDSTLKTDSFYLKYYRSLLQEEEKAEINQAGVWANSKISLKRRLSYKLKTLFNIIPFRQK